MTSLEKYRWSRVYVGCTANPVLSVIGLSLIMSGGGIYMVGVVTSSVRSSATVVSDTVGDLLSGIEAADEVTALVCESRSVRI